MLTCDLPNTSRQAGVPKSQPTWCLLQADYALSRLVTLKERTEATESLAKMHLAQRRNELVSFDLMLTVISINIAFVGGVASLCGMNLWLAGSGAPSVCHAASVSFAYCMQCTRLLAFVRTKMTAGILLMACIDHACSYMHR